MTTTFKQAGAELGQAQLKLGLDFTPIFCRFGFSGFIFYFIGLIEKIGLVYLVLYISNILLNRFNFVDIFCRLGLVNMVQ